MNSLLAIIALIPQFTDIPITDAQANSIAFAVVTIAGLYNSYVHVATSDKVGLPSKK